MKIKEFEQKYNIGFDGCFAYDALFRLSKKLKEIGEEQEKEFLDDLRNLKY